MSMVAALQHLPAAERCKNWYAFGHQAILAGPRLLHLVLEQVNALLFFYQAGALERKRALGASQSSPFAAGIFPFDRSTCNFSCKM
jgi:hypothetical protein